MNIDKIKAAVNQIGQMVYLKTDEYQMARLVVEIVITPNEIKYMLSCGPELTMHYGFEISTEKRLCSV